MTLSGAWDKLRTDYVLRFLIMSLAFYAMSTFEGPVMSLKVVNALSHYTDWTIGHVHSGALGWVGMIGAGAVYHLLTRLWKTVALNYCSTSDIGINGVCWKVMSFICVATIGIVIYIVAMWISGIMQALMWRDYDEFGALTYTFAESVAAMHPYYVLRTVGGFIYSVGGLIMLYNVVMTIRQSSGATSTAEAVPAQA